MLNLQNKIVFITGASSGIGAACAEQFAMQGAALLLCARRSEKLNELARRLRQEYKISIHTFQLDVTDKEQVKNAIAALPLEWQRVHILINNAGLAAGLETIHDADVADIEAMIDTNVKGLLYITKAILPTMLKQNDGHIINIGSIAGHYVYQKAAVYCATKFAVNALTQGLRIDLFGTNIRVTAISPGAVETEFSRVRFKGDEEKAAAVYENMQPLTANDIADSVLYCASRPAHINISEMIILPTDQVVASTSMMARKTSDT